MKVILIILDGWGIAPPSYGNAITQASTPTLNSLEASYPSLLLQASGIAVGIPWGEEGNSEVGHLNIGAGRIVPQYLPRIIEAIRDESFFKNKALRKAARHVKKNSSSFHIMGLVSSGSVHSYIDHVDGLLEFAKRESLPRVYLHIFTDGKDSPPEEAVKLVAQLKERMETKNLGKISSIVGRIFAMDRNEHWEYTKTAYELITEGRGTATDDPVTYLEKSYKEGVNDQRIEPAIVEKQGTVRDGDAVVFFNFREDSARQLTRAFINDDFDNFNRKKIKNLAFVAMTQYEESVPRSMVAFPPIDIKNTLGEVLSTNNKTQLRIAESEKYAHITYFFNGLKEKPLTGEERILIPSQGAPHYEKYPEMQAPKIAQHAVERMKDFDFILINFANADMLAHTGDVKAATQGVEVIDTYIKMILENQDKNTTTIITSDHGNAEDMLNARTGEVRTEHSSNPVPFYFVDKKMSGGHPQPLSTKQTRGILGDVAPTILELMKIPIPKEMTGKSLLPILMQHET